MRNADYKDVVNELEKLSEEWRSGVPPLMEKDLPEIYSSLADMVHSDAVINFMRYVECLKSAYCKLKYSLPLG